MNRGTFKQMKSTNKSLILNNIRQCDVTSRAQIAKDTSLTPPTVSAIVKELIESNLVMETEELGASQGGRKPKLLKINHSGHHIFGLDVSSQRVLGIITDLNGKILFEEEITLPRPIDNTKFLECMMQIIDTLFTYSKKNKVLGIGIAMHGIVNSEDGVAIFAPNLNLKNIPLKEILEDKYEVKVKVENDVRSMVLGEVWFNGNESFQNLVLINLGSGVGSGVIMDGKLIRGSQGLAGEFGHMIVNIHEGIKCDCGNYGCIETLISGMAIEKKAKAKKLIEEKESAKQLRQLADKGNKEAKQIFEEVGLVLGIGITNLIHLINPDKIILSGGISNANEYFLPKVKEIIHRSEMISQVGETLIEVSTFKQNAASLGACALFLEELYK
ncbi:ROK family transcriptional regulator [Macrococcus capreoli]|uniref:ROK family transcriptional regulator n=1 Tax=Macrococcus capreoli TaxID=2982690 RepID=UPI0021D5CBF9|nr:ROK family transcriptional regulator [Macrococcus sp. TMW 2.2395]MCU7556127.1 ROK family transcriptional regulator [Macrococcus sp. TMW 2.2395]